VHPGQGLILPVDAHPRPLVYENSGGVLVNNRRQPFDASFTLEPTDRVWFHTQVADNKGRLHNYALSVPSRPGVRAFDDSDPTRYWSAANPWNSVKVLGTGTRIEIADVLSGGNRMRLVVDPVG
jgi:immune inhibitor A